MSTIHSNLRKARERAGLTQAELAKRAGLQPAAISFYETGERSPGVDNLTALCRALGVSADKLLGLTAPAPQRSPEEVAARVGLLWHALRSFGATHQKDTVWEVARPLLEKHGAQRIHAAFRDLYRWAADRAAPETAAALEAAAGEMSKD